MPEYARKVMKVRTAGVTVFVAAFLAAIVGYQLGFKDGRRVNIATTSQTDADHNERNVAITVTSDSTNVAIRYDTPRRRTFSRATAIRSSDELQERLHPLLFKLSPEALSNPQPIPAHRRHFDDRDLMNEYRIRWEQQLRSSDGAREPVFNPSSVERVLER